MHNLSLLSTIHDPESRLTTLIDKREIDWLISIFDKLCFSITRESKATRNLLQKFDVELIAGHDFGESRIDLIKRDNSQAFYCDFDKLLHWLKVNPTEISNLLNIKNTGLTVLGPTSFADKSYSKPWRETKNIINKRVEMLFDISDIDIYEAAFIVSNECRIKLGENLKEKSWGNCVEVPLLANKLGFPVSYMEFSGLSWEDPDR